MGISIWQLLIILAIILLLFGAKRLRNVGSDLGTAIKGFRNAVKDGETDQKGTAQLDNKDKDIIEGEVQREKDKA